GHDAPRKREGSLVARAAEYGHGPERSRSLATAAAIRGAVSACSPGWSGERVLTVTAQAGLRQGVARSGSDRSPYGDSWTSLSPAAQVFARELAQARQNRFVASGQ